MTDARDIVKRLRDAADSTDLPMKAMLHDVGDWIDNAEEELGRLMAVNHNLEARVAELEAATGEAMAVLKDVAAERTQQDRKWGEQNHGSDRWLVILMEEVGEAAQAGLEADAEAYRAEMVQVAAVAINAIESLDRQTAKAAAKENE